MTTTISYYNLKGEKVLTQAGSTAKCKLRAFRANCTKFATAIDSLPCRRIVIITDDATGKELSFYLIQTDGKMAPAVRDKETGVIRYMKF